MKLEIVPSRDCPGVYNILDHDRQKASGSPLVMACWMEKEDAQEIKEALNLLRKLRGLVNGKGGQDGVSAGGPGGGAAGSDDDDVGTRHLRPGQ